MAQTTTNYKLVKPELKDAPPNITELNPNFDTIDTELKNQADQVDAHTKSISHVPHLGTTTNADDVYSITTTEAIGDNQKFSVKFNVVSTGTPTLSINGEAAIPIKKQNGNNAKVYASVYTLFKDGSVFTLLGEGGEYGTATSDQVLKGYTVGTETGVIQGTIPDYSTYPSDTLGYVAAVSARGDYGGDVVVEPPTGYYKSGTNANGFGAILARDEEYVPESIAVGKSIFGVNGTFTSDATVTESDMLAGKIGYGNGLKVIGNIPVLTGVRNATGVAKWSDGALAVYPEQGYQKGGAGDGEIKVSVAQLQSAEPSLIASNIKADTSLFGIVGTMQPKLYYEAYLGTIIKNTNVSRDCGFTPVIAILSGVDSSGKSSMAIAFKDGGKLYPQSVAFAEVEGAWISGFSDNYVVMTYSGSAGALYSATLKVYG